MKYWLSILFFFLFIYLFRLSSFLPQKIPSGTKLKVVGRVSNQPYLIGSNQIIKIDGFSVKTSRFPGYSYGDKLEVIGKVQPRVTGKFITEFVFDYPAICLLEEKESLINQTKVVRFLLNTKGRFERIIEKWLPEPQASLLMGILLGSKKQMSSDFLQELRDTGTIHIVVASGYNISVIAGFFLSFLVKFINRRKALIFAFLGVLAYTIMAGGEPPVVRAAIMGGLAYLAQYLGREKEAKISLLVAAVIILLISPLILFDISFQLSFLATAGILFIYRLFKGKIFEIPLLGEELKVTLAAQIGVLPILISNFGGFNLLSPLINTLVLPVIPLIMSLGGVLIFFGLIYGSLAQVLAWLSWLPLTYLVKVVSLFAKMNFGSFQAGAISFWGILGYYLLVTLWILRNSKPSLSA